VAKRHWRHEHEQTKQCCCDALRARSWPQTNALRRRRASLHEPLILRSRSRPAALHAQFTR